MEVPAELLHRAAEWENLKRWERKELGQELRTLGLTYAEIRKMIPVPKGTLSDWCRDIPLTDEQLERIRGLGGNSAAGRAKAGRVLRERNLRRTAAIREAGREEARRLTRDPDWVAGVVAYWAEGAKRTKQVKFSNSDPDLVRLFMKWAERFLDVEVERFTISLHLHNGQDEAERKLYWGRVTGFTSDQFRKTFWKSEGTGHRKNVLYNGTAQVRISCSNTIYHRIMGWIDHLAGRA